MPFIKKIRVGLSILFFLSITLLFMGAPYSRIVELFRFAALFQFTPSLLGTMNGIFVSVFTLFIILFITLLWGRVYCSVFCPLGFLMDSNIRIKGFLGFKKRTGFYPPSFLTRYGILIVLTLSILCANTSIFLEFIDPFSLYGKITTQLVVPAINYCWEAITFMFGFSFCHSQFTRKDYCKN